MICETAASILRVAQSLDGSLGTTWIPGLGRCAFRVDSDGLEVDIPGVDGLIVLPVGPLALEACLVGAHLTRNGDRWGAVRLALQLRGYARLARYLDRIDGDSFFSACLRLGRSFRERDLRIAFRVLYACGSTP